MKDGVQYILRFGETVADTGEEPTEGRNRYLFVTARVDMDKFPQPELEVMPDLPAGSEPSPESTESPKTDPAEQASESESEGTAADEPATENAESKPAADREAAEAAILQERERINKENQRKLDEWNEKIQKAKEQVAELNTRFGDWYYVVSEEQYQKIRLPLSDLIKTKDAEKASAEDGSAEAGDMLDDDQSENVEAFRKLQERGLEP